MAAASLAALAPLVPVRVRRLLAPVRILRLLTTSPAQREIVATFARCGEVIAVLLGMGLHSFPFQLNLSLLCSVPLKFSLLCPP